MTTHVTRRNLFTSAAGLMFAAKAEAARKAPVAPGAAKSPVSLIHGDDRAKNITAALAELDKQLLPVLKTKKRVVIKPNMVSTTRQLAATHPEALRGILEWLAPRWKGEVTIAESSAGITQEGFDNFQYEPVARDFKRNRVRLVCLNEEARYETIPVLNGDLHPQPVRLAARLMDPDAFVISAGILKTHNVVIATLNVKNMTLGAPLKSKKGETPRWNDKRVYHGGVRQTHYGILRTAERMRFNWGVGVLDGFEGMEGNGPSMGTSVPSRIAIASPDMVACDRIGVEAMGIDPEWIACLQWCDDFGVGNYRREKIELRGESVEKVARKYRLHADIERELQWRGPLTELPPKLG